MFSGWSLVAKIIATGVTILLLSGGGCLAISKIKGCVRAEDKAATLEKAAEKNQEVQNADEASKKQLEGMTDEELAEYARTGVMPERLRNPSD
jgi:hypothetical protein